jgi:NADH-quinone oxidoreductase subunit L
MLFIGAIGKSAQLPLSIWLPDAMAGPTPVSALIHAATMVTAGVYLLSRIHPIIDVSASWVPMLIAWTGAITALLAATVALAQSDIKKVLAYSTVEMLGYMFLAVGIGAYWAAIFLMIVHAFFKALLFLCAGSVIHGMHENQDMRVMGGLRVLMPVTFVAYIAGWLSLAGVPPFSGFWAKDEILAYAWQQNKALWAVGIAAAFLTAMYIGRQFFMVFTGPARWPEFMAAIANDGTTVPGDASGEPDSTGEATDATDATDEAALAGAASVALVTGAGVEASPDDVDFHPLPEGFTPHESPWTMTVPLVVLAGLAAVGGLISLPVVPQLEFLYDWLKPVFAGSATTLELSNATVYALLVFSSLVALAGTGVAVWVWYLGRGNAARLAPAVLRNAWYYDDAVASVVGGPGTDGFSAVATFDSNVVDSAVGGVGGGASRLGQWLRHSQDGNVRRYALAIGIGSVLALAFMLTRVVA